MLRHACGYALANKGHDTRALQAYLGHRKIQHTVRYTELSPTRVQGFLALLEPIQKVVESDESFVIPCAAPESSLGCRDVET